MSGEEEYMNNNHSEVKSNGQEDGEQSRGEDYSEREDQAESSLTKKVWPHTKLFLHIVRKMAKKGLINQNEKTNLKEYILSGGHAKLEAILGRYEKDGESETLFSQIRALLG